jgi:hypothetical protein
MSDNQQEKDAEYDLLNANLQNLRNDFSDQME